MPLMPHLRRPKNPHYSVVLGPCPGCGLWQLDYHFDTVAREWRTANAFFAALDEVVEEHLAECPDLQMIVEAGLFE